METNKSEDIMKYIWDRLGMPEDEWQALARAFYDLAHNDFAKYRELPESLKEGPIGRLCSQYIETGDHEYVEKAGQEITGITSWYVYLGRIM